MFAVKKNFHLGLLVQHSEGNGTDTDKDEERHTLDKCSADFQQNVYFACAQLFILNTWQRKQDHTCVPFFVLVGACSHVCSWYCTVKMMLQYCSAISGWKREPDARTFAYRLWLKKLGRFTVDDLSWSTIVGVRDVWTCLCSSAAGGKWLTKRWEFTRTERRIILEEITSIPFYRCSEVWDCNLHMPTSAVPAKELHCYVILHILFSIYVLL